MSLSRNFGRVYGSWKIEKNDGIRTGRISRVNGKINGCHTLLKIEGLEEVLHQIWDWLGEHLPDWPDWPFDGLIGNDKKTVKAIV